VKTLNLFHRYLDSSKEKRIYYRHKFFENIILQRGGSQFGEDKSIIEYLHTIGRYKISYLDISANHPKIHSNTHLFYRIGGSGVLIDANPGI
jgi:hypothetical protein